MPYAPVEHDSTIGYIRLAYAILIRAIRDVATRSSTRDARSAQEFLVSPMARWLIERLGLSWEHVWQRINVLADEPPDEWLSLREAAHYLGCHHEWLRRCIHRGQLPAQRTRSGHWRVARSVLEAHRGRL